MPAATDIGAALDDDEPGLVAKSLTAELDVLLPRRVKPPPSDFEVVTPGATEGFVVELWLGVGVGVGVGVTDGDGAGVAGPLVVALGVGVEDVESKGAAEALGVAVGVGVETGGVV